MIFVTAVNERYKPGAIALWNSFKRFHREPHEFWCIAFGNGQLADDLMDAGMEVLLNPRMPDVKLPAPGVWDAEHIDQNALKALYVRLFLPEYFPDAKRVTWIDADSNFINAVCELDSFNMQGAAIAAHITHKKPKIFDAMGENLSSYHNIKTGTILYDVPRYMDMEYPGRLIEFIHENGDKFDASTCNCAINYIIHNDVCDFGPMYTYNAKRGTPHPEAKILHWSICEPWACENKPLGIQKQIEKWWKPYA